jgi:hypothetical protein
LTPLPLIDSLSFSTYCYGYWLRVVTSTTLNGTLSSLGGLCVVTLELIGLVVNMFYTLIFLGHYPNLCFAIK